MKTTDVTRGVEAVSHEEVMDFALDFDAYGNHSNFFHLARTREEFDRREALLPTVAQIAHCSKKLTAGVKELLGAGSGGHIRFPYDRFGTEVVRELLDAGDDQVSFKADLSSGHSGRLIFETEDHIFDLYAHFRDPEALTAMVFLRHHSDEDDRTRLPILDMSNDSEYHHLEAREEFIDDADRQSLVLEELGRVIKIVDSVAAIRKAEYEKAKAARMEQNEERIAKGRVAAKAKMVVTRGDIITSLDEGEEVVTDIADEAADLSREILNA
jgi:hypothetical protein